MLLTANNSATNGPPHGGPSFLGDVMSKEKSFIADIAFICLCCALTALLGVGIFILPRKTFSEQENRALASPPSFSLSALADGKYYEQASAFYSDHIPFRSKMIMTKAVCELSFGKKQNNSVIFEGDGTLTARPEYSDTAILKKNIAAIDAFASSYDAELIIIPRSIDVGDHRFESQAPIKQHCNANLTARLRELWAQGKRPYYKTDHHLNHVGVFELYSELSVSLGFTPADFREQKLSDSFLGSTYSRAGLIGASSDEIILLRYDGDEDVSVACFDKGCEQCSLYSLERLNVKDKYTVFLGGNHGLLKIGDEKKPRLLLVKDSFANALIPLLSRHFDITAVDPRYYKGSISELAGSGEFDRVLVLFGIDTLASHSLSKSFIH